MARKTTPSGNSDKTGGVLDALGVVGCAGIEPVVIAALAQRDPLLLIGPHGTGKSMLLTRLSAALGLEFRHYNASLLCFDDLIGYPLPDSAGSLRYIQTPATIWGAQAVFFDELSRCRPEVQNKLFSIIHERKLQGLPLNGLQYRWSAMNPPAADGPGEYAGSEPLDRALADRFPFVVGLPGWSSFSEHDQERLITASDDAPSAEVAESTRRVVESVARRSEIHRRAFAAKLAIYVRVVTGLLNQAAIAISPRRAAMLFRNICGVHAARLETRDGSASSLADSAYLALCNSLCQRAYGEETSAVKVAAAHKEAWKASASQDDSAFRAVLLEPDPLRRGVLALSLREVSKADFSTVVADCLASLPAGARHAFAASVLESSAAERLVAAVAEECAELYELLDNPQNLHESVVANSTRHTVWQHVVARLAKLDKNSPDTKRAENLLVGLFARKDLATPSDVDGVLDRWMAARRELGAYRA